LIEGAADAPPGTVAAEIAQAMRTVVGDSTLAEPRVEPTLDDETTGSLTLPEDGVAEVVTPAPDAGTADPERVVPAWQSMERDASADVAREPARADVLATVEDAPDLSTTRRVLLRMSNRRAATAAAAAVVLSVAAIASPGVLRWRHPVTDVPGRVHKAAPLPAPAPVPPIPAAVVPAAAPAAPLEVKVTSSRPCWVRVTVDGRTSSLMLAAGDEIVRSAENEIQVRIGDAAAVTLEVNGRALPPLGRTGQVVDRTFTADTLFEDPPPTFASR
jgi:hypothetical protein